CDVVLERHANFQHVELQVTDRGQHRRLPLAVQFVEELYDAFFFKLGEALIELLALGRIRQDRTGEMLGLEAGHGLELHRLAQVQRIPYRKGTGVYETDHVARVGFVHRLPLLAEELVRTLQPNRRARPPVCDHHVLFEAARANTHVSHPVTMARVEVRLHLEYERSEVGTARVDGPAVAQAGTGRRRKIDEGLNERLDPEVRDGAAEKDGRQLSLQEAVSVEGAAGLLQELGLLPHPFVQVFRDERTDGGIVKAALHYGRPLPTAFRPLKPPNLLPP